MINISKIIDDIPHNIFKEYYDKAMEAEKGTGEYASKDFDISKSLPTNRINSSMLDYGFFQAYSLVSSKINMMPKTFFLINRC